MVSTSNHLHFRLQSIMRNEMGIVRTAREREREEVNKISLVCKVKILKKLLKKQIRRNTF